MSRRFVYSLIALISVLSAQGQDSTASRRVYTPVYSDGPQAVADSTVCGCDCRVALKTNMLYDAALIPDIGVELPLGRRFSVAADWMYTWLRNTRRNRHWRIYGGDLAVRWWPGAGARTLTGHHFGLYGTVLVYQVAFGGRGYISGIPGEDLDGSPWWGGGVEYGYSLRVHRRLNIDLSLGVGYAGGEQREYRMVDDCYVWQASRRRQWFGPTKAEVSLVWLIGPLPESRRGADGLRKEVRL